MIINKNDIYIYIKYHEIEISISQWSKTAPLRCDRQRQSFGKAYQGA